MAKEEKDGLPVLRPSTFQKIYGTRALAMSSEYDFRILLANEKMVNDDKKEFFVGEAMAILTPLAAKELHKELGKLIRAWEKERGKIQGRSKSSQYSEQVLKED